MVWPVNPGARIHCAEGAWLLSGWLLLPLPPRSGKASAERARVAATKLILIRHGQTDHQGGEGAYLDGWNDLELSPFGHQQVEALGRRLRQEPGAEAVYSSPLKRARQTAEKLFPVGLHRVIVRDELREIHCGDFEGVPVSRVKSENPVLWEANLRRDDPDFRWPRGESYREFRARAVAVLRSIVTARPGVRVLVVTHCGLITQFLGWIHRVSPARWDKFRPGTASVTEVVWDGAGARLVRFDDRSHLKAFEK